MICSFSLFYSLSFSLFLLLVLKRNSGMVYESAVCRYRIALISQRLLKEEKVERDEGKGCDTQGTRESFSNLRNIVKSRGLAESLTCFQPKVTYIRD